MNIEMCAWGLKAGVGDKCSGGCGNILTGRDRQIVKTSIERREGGGGTEIWDWVGQRVGRDTEKSRTRL